MLQVPHKVIEFPTPIYRGVNGNTVGAMRASRWKWPTNGETFYKTGPRQFKYVILAGPGVDESSPGFYNDELLQYIGKCGLNNQQATRIGKDKINPFLDSTDEDVLEAKLKEAKCHNALLVILVMKEYSLKTY
jgi:hypothetical protein